MPMTRPLNNSLPLLWWLLPEECIDFCWHWKDAQKIKITKSSGNSLCRDKKLLLSDAWTGPVSKDVSHRELCVSSAFWAPWHERQGEFRTKYAIFKDAYISSKKGWYCRQRQGLPLKDTSSYRQCHLCAALPILKCHLQRRNSYGP